MNYVLSILDEIAKLDGERLEYGGLSQEEYICRKNLIEEIRSECLDLDDLYCPDEFEGDFDMVEFIYGV